MSLKSGIWALADMEAINAKDDIPFHVYLDEPTMSAELFELPAGGVDTQKPHDLDELYYIIAGRADFDCDGETRPVQTGDTIFVAAKVPHHFHSITEDLKILVVFSKKEP